jgi:hypothetical protein
MMTTKNHIISTLALFGSFSTLLCCALPALFVSLGAGAALIGLVNAVPQLIWLSKHKVALFVFSGCMLMLSGITRYLSRNSPCPIDPLKAQSCKKLRRFSGSVFLFSLALYTTGFFFAFIAQYLR